jgi:hypothetical protein
MSYTATTKDGRVHIEFERTDGVNKLVDAIVVGPAQYAAWTEDDINAIIEQRWQDYLVAITPPPEPVPPEGFEFERDEYGNIVYDENGEPVLVASEVTDVEFTEGEE